MDATLDQSPPSTDDCFLMNFFPPCPQVLQLCQPIVSKKSNAHLHLFRSVFVSLYHWSPKIVFKLHVPWGQMSTCHLKPYTRVFTGANFLEVTVSMCFWGHTHRLVPWHFMLTFSQALNALSYFIFLICHLSSAKSVFKCISMCVNMCTFIYVCVYTVGDVEVRGEFNHTLTDVCGIDFCGCFVSTAPGPLGGT